MFGGTERCNEHRKECPDCEDFFTAIGSHNERDLLALVAGDIEWIIPGEGRPLAGTYRGHAELAAVLKKASKEVETKYPTPPEFVSQGDRVLVIGVATAIPVTSTNSFLIPKHLVNSSLMRSVPLIPDFAPTVRDCGYCTAAVHNEVDSKSAGSTGVISFASL